MQPFAFAFFATQWRPDLTWPLQMCLHSLDQLGGAAASYPRYLVYPETITPEIREFCDRHRLILQPEKRFTYRQPYVNKALMCKVPEHDVVCLTDLDIMFLADPTPMFERVRESGAVHARADLMFPLWPWPNLPEEWRDRLRFGPGLSLWRAQYRRFAPRGAAAAREIPRPGGGTMPFYFNDGVVFVPGKYLRQVGESWRYVSMKWLRDVALRRPFTAFFTNHFASQIAFPMAIHRAQLPWELLPSTHNLIPSDRLDEADARIVREDAVVMAHLVSGVRAWINPEAPGESVEARLPLYRRVRQVVESFPELSRS